MEPGDGVHEGEPGMQALLCGAVREKAGLRFQPGGAAPGTAGDPAALEEAEADICEFDERFVP